MLKQGGTVFAVAALALAVWAPSAYADFGMTPFDASGTTTQAGGHPDFTTDVTFTGSEDVKRLTFHLPNGLNGNPNVTPLCSQDTFNNGTCPDNTQVGTTTVFASSLGVPLPQSDGKVFNLEPSPGEPARLGVVVQTDPFGVTGSIKIPVSASLRPNDSPFGPGLDATTATDIPNSVGPGPGIPLHVTRQILTLQGQPPAASGPFMTNPTGCPNPPLNVAVDAISYSSSNASASDPYPVTGCELLPFAPKMIAAADVSGGSAPGTHVGLSTLITQGPNEANPQRVTVTLPDSIKADTDVLARICTPANLAAHTCPDSSIIGSAFAITPLLSQPVSGPVYATAGTGGLLGFTALMSGPVDLVVSGYANTPNNIIVSTFDNLPDVPIPFFALKFNSGPNGSLLAAKDMCATPPQQVKADILAHSGATATLTPTMGVQGCPVKPPTATVTAKHLGRPRPVVNVQIDGNGTELTGAAVKLPRQLSAKQKKRGIKTGTARIKTKVKRHKVTVSKVPAGATKLSLKLSRGAVTSSPSLRRKLKKGGKAKLRFKVTVRRKGTPAVTLKVTAKSSR